MVKYCLVMGTYCIFSVYLSCSFAIDDSLYLYHREEKKKKIQVEDLVETVEEKQSEEKKVV